MSNANTDKPSDRSDRRDMPSSKEFERSVGPLRREIKVHCYRMMGSLQESEDLLQETLLRAWRSFDRFEAGGSLRAWLYRIATNACLNALESRRSKRRLLPEQMGPASAPEQVGAPNTEVAWLEPLPDADIERIADQAPDPEACALSRESIRLAFVAAIQQLPPRQRAALLLCDVLEWKAAEAAALLGGSTASINSAIQRARATLHQRDPAAGGGTALPCGANEAELLARYVKAWESHDANQFVALLKEEATVCMPPWSQWFIGREPVRTFFARAWANCRGLRLLPISANGQPAFAAYERQGHGGTWAANAIHVLALEADAISAVTLFVQPHLFEHFGLQPVLHDRQDRC